MWKALNMSVGECQYLRFITDFIQSLIKFKVHSLLVRSVCLNFDNGRGTNGEKYLLSPIKEYPVKRGMENCKESKFPVSFRIILDY